MKFGASTFIWVSPFSNDTLYLFDKVREFGFDALEICIEDPKTIDAAAIKKASDESGIDALICGAFGPDRDISSHDKGIREKGLDYIKYCVDAAQSVGSTLVSGPMYSTTGKTRLLSKDEKKQQWDWAIENMKIAADYAKTAGVKLAVETLNRFETDFLNTVEQGLEFFGLIGKDNVGFLLDTFHMNIEEKNLGEAIVKAGDKVFNFHACANDRGTPGTGHIDWEAVKNALDAIGYAGYLTIESFTTDITEIARAVSLWRPLAESSDALATEGVDFLKGIFK